MGDVGRVDVKVGVVLVVVTGVWSNYPRGHKGMRSSLFPCIESRNVVARGTTLALVSHGVFYDPSSIGLNTSVGLPYFKTLWSSAPSEPHEASLHNLPSQLGTF